MDIFSFFLIINLFLFLFYEYNKLKKIIIKLLIYKNYFYKNNLKIKMNKKSFIIFLFSSSPPDIYK